MRRILALIVTVLAVAASATAARADSGPVSRFTPTTSIQFREVDGDKLVVETTVGLLAGERRHLHARLEVVSSHPTLVVALNAVIKCFTTGSSPQLAGTASTSTRNHEGSTAPYAVQGHLPLLVDLLLVAPQTGSYRCGLYAKTGSTSPTTYNLAVVTGGQTFLEVSSGNQAGAGWWENPSCDSKGTEASCTFLGKGQPSDAFVFYDDGTSRIKWPVGGGNVQALANVTVTTCYKESASCGQNRVPDSDREKRIDGSRSVVDLRMDLVQLDTAGGSGCRTTSVAKTATVSDDAHHLTTFLSLPSVAPAAGCGSQFLLRVYVKHVSGSPIKIDGRQGATSLTNGILMNVPRP